MHYLVEALQDAKRAAHREALGRYADIAGRVLKTDLYEEAYGRDALLDLLLERGDAVAGVDIDRETVRRARRRFPEAELEQGDVRDLPFPDAVFDAVVSTSTLDNMDGGFGDAVAELGRVLVPGGTLLLTLDNAHNPAYRFVRGVDRVLGYHDFRLGRAPALPETVEHLARNGFVAEAVFPVMRYPPAFNTLLRPVAAVSDRAADRLVDAARLDTDRLWSGWFYGVAARKRPEGSRASGRRSGP